MKNLEITGKSGDKYIAFEQFGAYYVMPKAEYNRPIWNEREKRRIDGAQSLKDCENVAKWL